MPLYDVGTEGILVLTHILELVGDGVVGLLKRLPSLASWLCFLTLKPLREPIEFRWGSPVGAGRRLRLPIGKISSRHDTS